MENNKNKVVYIHGRPSGHPMHDAYANALDSDFIPVDFILPWHENPNSSKVKRYLSWLLCALFFPKRKQYNVFFTEAIREPVLIMKYLGLMRRDQKIIPLMANETLFFYHNNRYSKIVMWMIEKYLKKSDAIICVGEFQSELARKIVGENQTNKIYTVNNWVFPDKSTLFSKVEPNLNSHKILFIGDISADFRAWYKGVDLMINGFIIAARQNADIVLEMIGVNDEKYIEKYLLNIPSDIKSRIFIRNKQPVLPFFETSSLYLHCARGEAWGITIMEALLSGVPVICSEITGAKEIVEKISTDLVVPADEKLIAEKIIWYFSLPLLERLALAKKGREVMLEYSEEKSLERFNSVYNKLLKELYS